MVWWALPFAKSEIYTWRMANSTRPFITANCRISWFYLEHSLWVKYSCKIITQNILVTSARGTLKAKRNSRSFNWYLGRRNQRTWIPLNQCGMNLTERSQINNQQMQLTSGNSCMKAGQNYLQSTSIQSFADRMLRICEAVTAAKGSHFDESKVLKVFCVLFF